MTRKEAIELYTQKYGGFPYFLFLGAEDETVVKAVEEALSKGEKIKVQNKDSDY